jgi:hypothetical protein
LNDAKTEWTPIEEIERKWEEAARPKRDQEQKAAEHEATAARELFIDKNTMPFNEAVITEVLERVSCGQLVIDICDEPAMPTVRRWNQWLRANPDLAGLYKESVADRLDIFSEEIIRIADDASRDFKDVMRGGRAVRVADGEVIARSKLKVEMRLRHLKVFRPALWGESSTVNVRAQEDVDLDGKTMAELEALISEFQRKDGIIREPSPTIPDRKTA